MLPNSETLPVEGEQDQQGRNWNEVHTRLVRYLRARGARDDIAEDIAQETLTRLITISRSQAIGSLFALGFRIADNLLIDQHRDESRHAGAPEEDWLSDAPSPDRVLDSRRAVDVFHRCLRRMPPLRREVLIRRRMRQESHRAIGEALSLSTKAVEKHITRGLIDLRRAMEKAGIDLAGWD